MSHACTKAHAPVKHTVTKLKTGNKLFSHSIYSTTATCLCRVAALKCLPVLLSIEISGNNLRIQDSFMPRTIFYTDSILESSLLFDPNLELKRVCNRLP